MEFEQSIRIFVDSKNKITQNCMLAFEKFVLKNGLRVIIHEDHTSPMAVLNVMYDVGSKDEHAEKTGFAHLFEHLMFGGSVNIPSYDEPLQLVGGENNAFTNNDITNYYIQLPAVNLETAFWLESDRMLSLAFSKKSLDVQRNVVCEEFKQRYLNQPYGDVWLKLRPLAYKVHPYQWATIGKELSHIENATIEDVKAFFHKHYNPSNAIVCITGNVNTKEVLSLAEKWFEPIAAGEKYVRNLPKEPKQEEARAIELRADVPVNAIYKAFHMSSKLGADYYADDLISDILSRGDSSRFYLELVKKKKIFSSVNAYVSGDMEEGLFIIDGKLSEGVDMKKAEDEIQLVLEDLQNTQIDDNEMTKLKNKMESTILFSRLSNLDKAINFCYYELLGDANLFNNELTNYCSVSKEKIQERAKSIFRKENCSSLYYYAN